MKRKNLYTETGEPKRVRCYWSKTGGFSDPITVVFTYAHCLDKTLTGRVFYIGIIVNASSGKPEHDVHLKTGGCYHGEMEAWKFKGCGSIVKFGELPPECQETVRREYNNFWEEEA